METIFRLGKIFYLPGTLYFAFLVLKLTGNEPGVDLNGMHSTMGAIFLSGGTAVAYLMSILPMWVPFRSAKRVQGNFWFLSAIFLFLLLYDACFRIHETFQEKLGVEESFVFIFYGILLVILIGVYRETFHKPFWRFFAGFVILSAMAVFGDTFGGDAHAEGFVVFQGHAYSWEQFFETLSTLLLSSAFASEAISDLKREIFGTIK